MWLRRDRIMLPAWVYALTALVATTVYSFKGLYDTAASRTSFAAGTNANASMKALYGPVLDSGSVGGLTAWRIGATGAAFAGVMSVLLVVRHTRAEEETGRLELVGAAVVGRRAPLTAALLVAVIANVVLAVLSALVLVVFGMPVAGSVAFGLSWLGTGLVFAGVAALTAQLTETSRLANGLALTVLGLAFLLRALGDAGSAHWLSWLSPIGWAQQVRPYAGERWPVLLLPLAAATALTVAAYALTGRRDLGAGILPASPGPARAARSLRGPLTLSWRLQRGTLLGWAAGFVVYGLAIGGIADGIGALADGSAATLKAIKEMGGQQGVVDAFLATAMSLMGLFTAAYAVQGVLRMRGEETAQRLEPLLAAPVARRRWALAQLAVTAAGTVVLLAVTGLCVGLTHGLRVNDVSGQVPRLTAAALVQVPAVWVIAAVAVLLFGFAPRAVPSGWGVLAVCVLLGQVGPLLKLPQAVMDVSPFTHTPKLPGPAFTALPPVALVAVAVLATAAGLYGFTRRDIG
jgi:ABC-2 type transport system permease protein